MNSEGAGGPRQRGAAGQPGQQPGQLNGMPSKKSQSTSKLSVKGEQGNCLTAAAERAERSLVEMFEI